MVGTGKVLSRLTGTISSEDGARDVLHEMEPSAVGGMAGGRWWKSELGWQTDEAKLTATMSSHSLWHTDVNSL